MGYTDDWESLMNGVFGPGGKLRYDVQKPPEKTGLPDLNAALLEQQKKLDEMLKKQNAALRGGTAQETLAQSRKMLEEMEADGLLAKGTAEVGQEHLGSFEGLAAEVKKTVLGQDAFVDGVVRAMRRPFVLGTEPPTARNVILLCGAPGTGRHFTLTETARCMAARGLLRSDRLAVMDLALYPGSGAEKLFLQDLYAALHAPGEIVVFEHYESCCPGFLKTLADLAPVQPVSRQQGGHSGGRRDRPCPRGGEPHHPLRQVPRLLLPEGPGGAGRQIRCALRLGAGRRLRDGPLCPGGPRRAGGPAAQRAGREGESPPRADPRGRGGRAGLCGRPVQPAAGRGGADRLL